MTLARMACIRTLCLVLACLPALSGCSLVTGGTSERALRSDLEASIDVEGLGEPASVAYQKNNCLDVCSALTLRYDRSGKKGAEICEEVIAHLARQNVELHPGGGMEVLSSPSTCHAHASAGRFNTQYGNAYSAYSRGGTPPGEYIPQVSWGEGVLEIYVEG